MRGRMPLQIAVMHLYDSDEENSEKCDEQKSKSNKVFEGVISHKWQSCSTADNTIVKYLLTQLTYAVGSLEICVASLATMRVT